MNLSSDETQDTPADALVPFVTEYARDDETARSLKRAYGRYVPGSAAREARNWMWTHDVEGWWERDSEPDEADEDDTDEGEESDDGDGQG